MRPEPELEDFSRVLSIFSLEPKTPPRCIKCPLLPSVMPVLEQAPWQANQRRSLSGW